MPFIALIVGAILGLCYNGNENWLLVPIITLLGLVLLSQTRFRLFGLDFGKAIWIGLGCAMFLLGVYYHEVIFGVFE